MRPINVLVCEDWRDHRLDEPPGPKNRGGGPRVKYARMRSFPDIDLILSVDEVTHDVVFADWLYFGSIYLDNRDNANERLKGFMELDVPVRGILGTELAALRWPALVREKLLEYVDVVTHVNEYHRRMYKYAGIQQSRFIGDPVPEYTFYPAQKEKRLVCMGQIGWHKRSDLVLELFTRLKDSDIETCYIGSAKMWGYYEDSDALAMQEQIEAVADVFIENGTQDQVAFWLNRSTFYGHLAWHDCSPISQRECMMAGLITFALTHPSMAEITPYRYVTVEEMAEAIMAYPKAAFEAESVVARERALELNSYAAVTRQFGRVVEGVL